MESLAHGTAETYIRYSSLTLQQNANRKPRWKRREKKLIMNKPD
jgi:hypothetical protein